MWGSIVLAAQRRFYCIGRSYEVLLYWPLKGSCTVLAAQRRFYCTGRSCEVLLYWSLKGGSTVLAAQRRFYCIGHLKESLVYWPLEGGSTVLAAERRFYCTYDCSGWIDGDIAAFGTRPPVVPQKEFIQPHRGPPFPVQPATASTPYGRLMFELRKHIFAEKNQTWTRKHSSRIRIATTRCQCQSGRGGE